MFFFNPNLTVAPLHVCGLNTNCRVISLQNATYFYWGIDHSVPGNKTDRRKLCFLTHSHVFAKHQIQSAILCIRKKTEQFSFWLYLKRHSVIYPTHRFFLVFSVPIEVDAKFLFSRSFHLRQQLLTQLSARGLLPIQNKPFILFQQVLS